MTGAKSAGWIALFFLTICLTGPQSAAGQAKPLTARQILDLTDDLYRGQASHGQARMTITTAHWSRTLTLEYWTQGKDKSLFRILAPRKEKGTGTLRVDNNVWNYLPKIKRVIKLPSSMMSAGWMGSHVTNNDLVKESRMAEDYNFEITARNQRNGVPEIEVTCLPKREAAVVWGKVVVRVRQADYMPTIVYYYDEEMKLARTMAFEDVKQFGDRTIPSKVVVVPQDKPNEKTELVHDNIEFKSKLPDDVFTLRNLRR